MSQVGQRITPESNPDERWAAQPAPVTLLCGVLGLAGILQSRRASS